MTLKDLIEQKETTLISVKASVSAIEGIQTMCEHKVGSLLVYSDDGELLGIATERDILRFCADKSEKLGDALIVDVISRELMVAQPECSIDEAMSLMTEHRFRHLPVIEGGVPIGMISIGDLVKAKLKDVSVEVKYLLDYISA